MPGEKGLETAENFDIVTCAVEFEDNGGGHAGGSIGQGDHFIDENAGRLAFFVDLTLDEDDTFFGNSIGILEIYGREGFGEKGAVDLAFEVLESDHGHLLAGGTAVFGDGLADAGHHAPDDDFGVLAGGESFFSGGGGIAVKDGLMLCEGMAGYVETEQFFFEFEKIGGVEFGNIGQGDGGCSGSSGMLGSKSCEHVHLAAAAILLRLLAHLNGAVEDMEQLGAAAAEAGEGAALDKSLEGGAVHVFEVDAFRKIVEAGEGSFGPALLDDGFDGLFTDAADGHETETNDAFDGGG